jgi:hypothetical protein
MCELEKEFQETSDPKILESMFALEMETTSDDDRKTAGHVIRRTLWRANQVDLLRERLRSPHLPKETRVDTLKTLASLGDIDTIDSVVREPDAVSFFSEAVVESLKSVGRSEAVLNFQTDAILNPSIDESRRVSSFLSLASEDRTKASYAKHSTTPPFGGCLFNRKTLS